MVRVRIEGLVLVMVLVLEVMASICDLAGRNLGNRNDTPTTGALVSKNRLSSVRRASVVGVRHRPSRGYDEAESKQDKIVLLTTT